MLTLIAIYLLAGLAYYIYAIVKSYEALRFWKFKPVDGYIGVCKYPKWLLFWVEWILKKD